ncbi:hypothetical protein MAPG_09533 [Magnaporthiopsis poae ATCC 64411]|uniref:Uncharacterized protein n=1 Tax=Magnaporthiopsis poae (strain ATCC 64411 / 73-15) TaxID=644358 RepID=A0A0C4EA74_MAGP6|nr:hypothetical protein MAPG_09533 [Magnaporthiopsis poae ATCC 64411]
MPDFWELTHHKVVADQIENFAQEVVIVLFNAVVPGGIGTVANWAAGCNQYSTARSARGNSPVPGGRDAQGIVCTGPPASGQRQVGRRGSPRTPRPTRTLL